MSLLPLILNDQLLEMSRPSRILDQRFGLSLDPEDLFAPLTLPREYSFCLRPSGNYYRPWKTNAGKRDAGSTVSVDKDKFQVNLDVQQFAPEEITVKATGDNCITVEGKHEEKQDEHGFISRQFVRRYVLPKEHDIKQVVSTLSSDGVLTITAPRIDKMETETHNIPIQQTGVPSRSIENKQQGKGDEKK